MGILSRVGWMLARKGKVGIKESWEKTPARYRRDLANFLNWFDSARSVKEAVEKGRIDWEYRFKSSPGFSGVAKNTALEIGFGGGRLLVQAARGFTKVYGVDIHSSFDITQQFLNSQEIINCELLHVDEISVIPDGSIDYVYSFIVFQHFTGMDDVLFYLREVRRMLKKDGYAHVYIGKHNGEGVKAVSEEEFSVRKCSLFISPLYMKDLLEKEGFTVLRLVKDLPKNPVTGEGVSGQFSVEFSLR